MFGNVVMFGDVWITLGDCNVILPFKVISFLQLHDIKGSIR